MLLICLVLGGLTVDCRKKVVTAAPPPPPAPQQEPAPAPPKTPTASLIAEPATIERGQASTLRWSSTDATELTISGLGVVEGKGSREVRPAESTVYRLRATGPGGSATASAAVNVTVPAPPVVAAPQPPAKTFAQRVEEELADAYFDYDKSNIRDDAQAALAKDASVLNSILADFADVVVYIEGHCDERGSAEYNLGLGDRRAASASAYLEALGVDTTRLKTVSYGKERPQCTDATEECWQKNRRVHFSAVKPAPDYHELSITSGHDE
jgi:peptidoglycan-associated lipoprotein